MRVPEAPGRTFKIKVTRFEPNSEMAWRQGIRILFPWRPHYQLTPGQDQTATGFRMSEEFSGPLLPVIARRLPDFRPIFERYATVKSAAEK